MRLLEGSHRALEGAIILALFSLPAVDRVSAEDPELVGARNEALDASGEEPAELLDLREVDTSELDSFSIHGRLDLTFAYFEDTSPVDDFNRTHVLPLSPALIGSYHFLGIFEAKAEVGYDGLEKEVEVDRALVEAEILDENFKIALGRNVVPFGLERFHFAPSQNVFVDRPAAFRAVFPGTFSDYGIFAGGSYSHPDGWRLGYDAALSLGLQDRFDHEGVPGLPEENNDSKQFTGRLSFSPEKALGLGASYLVGNYDPNEVLQASFAGLDIEYEFYGFRLRSEVVGGKIERAPADGRNLYRYGYYVQLERRWELPWVHPRAIETALRFDYIDANTRVRDQFDLNRYALGINFEICEGLRWKFEYEINDQRGEKVAASAFFTQIEYHW
jgi:hypothetical protein